MYQEGVIGMMGGYLNYGKNHWTKRTLIDLEEGIYELSFDAYFVDSWDYERIALLVNAEVLWWMKMANGWGSGTTSSDYSYPGLYPYTRLEGLGARWADHVAKNITVEFYHSGGGLELKFTSTLNQASSDESFGLDEIKLELK